MRQRTFEALCEARWRRCETLLWRLERAGGARPAAPANLDEVAGFPALYRSVCHDLAMALERGYGPLLVDRLDDLVRRGHRVLYDRRSASLAGIAHFLRSTLPRRIRAEWRPIAVAAACFLGPGAAVYLAVLASPELVYAVLDAHQVRDFEGMYEPTNDSFGEGRHAASDLGMFGFYILNNIGVGFRAFATGIFLGLGPVFIMAVNGVLLGAVSAHMVHIGYEETFFPFVVGHAAFELTAIVIAGGAGMRLGWALVSPGRRSRAASLRAGALRALDLVYGVLAMLVAAAFIEAFWSARAAIPVPVKLGVAALLWSVVAAYVLLGGRRGGRA